MQLRPFRPKDESELVDLWFDSWRSVGLETPHVERSQLIDRLPRELAGRWAAVVAEDGDVLVGFIALAMDERRIDQLFVAPHSQGRGVGCALFGIALARLPNGFWLSTQPANARARAFYERRGMTLDRIDGSPGEEKAIYTYNWIVESQPRPDALA